ncbi:MAG: ABC-2 family transporter protein [Caldilineaceae bacterium]|nr:ABC-2 family transporter protein [Caldilineaceae bacterium]
MSHLLSVYKGYFRTSLAVQFQYRAAMFIWLLGAIMEPLVYLVVWRTVALQQGGSVGGYDVGGFAAYYLTMMLVNHFTFSWIMWEYDYRIRSGEFSSLLLKPVHPIHSDMADNWAYKLFTLTLYVPVAIGLAWLFRPTWNVEGWALLVLPVALILAFLTRFFLDWSLAMSAFWTTRVQAINQAYFVAMLFFSGRLAPLTLFPPWFQHIADFLPFRWVMAFPVELALGRLTPGQALIGFGVQLGWMAAGLLLLNLVYRAGIRRYAAFGG